MRISSVKGFEDYYQISDTGIVWSLDRTITYYRNKKLVKRKTKGLKLVPVLYAGYPAVTLRKNGVNKLATIHRQVYINFVEDIPKHLCINHIDGDKTNNNLSNLEMVTQGENIRHAWATGLQTKKFGEQRKNVAKLKDKQIHEIRKLSQLGVTQTEIANKYKLHQTTIHYILKGKTWTHIK